MIPSENLFAFDLVLFKIVCHCKINLAGIIIQTSTKTDDGRRVYNKKHFCFYCSKPQAKISRHLMTSHKNEAEILALEEMKGKARDAHLDKLRNLGNHIHNVEVLKEKKGLFIVGQRPNEEKQKPKAEDYAPCPLCYVYLIQRDIWRHKCKNNPEGEKLSLKKSKMIIPTNMTYATTLHTVLEGLRNGSIGRLCKSDDLIMEMGRKMCANHGQDVDQHQHIREKMRRAATLLTQLRIVSGKEDASLRVFLDPTHFQDLLAAARRVAGFDSNTNSFAVPSLPNKLSGLVKDLAAILESEALQKKDLEAVSLAQSLCKLVELNWKEVSVPANRQLDEQRFNKPQLLPLAEDIMKLSKFLRREGALALVRLSEERSVEAWFDLSKIVLAYLIMFNRRRAGEMGKAKRTSFQNRAEPANQALLSSSLSQMEQQLINSYKRMVIRGKRGRKVPVLMPNEVEAWMIALEDHRDVMGNPENPFLFPTKKGHGHLRGHVILKEMSQRCGAENPELLRSTKLRKQVATMSQLVNLQNNELDILARFLGHDVNIHREYYRLPEDHIQVAKVAKLLQASEKGQDITGMKLSDIQVTNTTGKAITILNLTSVRH